MSITEERIAAEDAVDIPALVYLRQFPVDHRAIWCEVIMQALDDARGSTIEREKARDFLLSETGEWAESRQDVCDAAGIDETYLRHHAGRRIADYDAGKRFKSARGHVTIERPPGATGRPFPRIGGRIYPNMKAAADVKYTGQIRSPQYGGRLRFEDLIQGWEVYPDAAPKPRARP